MFHSRDRHFNLEKDLVRSYTKLGTHGTDIINSLSLLFPVGEKFFIDTLRKFEPHIQDKNLIAECYEFYKQEARHSREHLKLNKILEDQGLDMDYIDYQIKQKLKKFKTDRERLIVTICLENMTHLLAYFIIHGQGHKLFKDTEYKKLLLWHATEELEHTHVPRAVAKYIGIKHPEVIKGMPRALFYLYLQIFQNFIALKYVH